MALLNFKPQQDTAEAPSPQHMMLVGPPKTGKSTVLSMLEGHGILNIEPGGADGYRFLKHIATTMDIKSFTDFKALVREAAAWSKANDNKKPYNYFAVDNMDVFQEWCWEQATDDYMSSVQGKAFNKWTAVEIKDAGLQGQVNVGDEKTGKHRKSVLTLGMNSYQWHRAAFVTLLGYLGYFSDKIIYVCHIKAKHLEKDGVDDTVRTVNLTGQIGPILAGICDACCFLKREGNKVIADFSVDDAISGCRIPSLEGKKITLSEKSKEGVITTYWSKIFPEIKEDKSVQF